MQPADIVDRITHHDEPRQSQTEGESVPFGGIDAALAQYVRIHQTAGQKFHPPAMLADRAAVAAADQTSDIEFETRFDEREISQGAAAPSLPS